MNYQEILEKAIQKAIDGGWRPDYFQEPVVAGISFEDYKQRIRFGSLSSGTTMSVQEVIFNHDFAKALWGEEHECKLCGYEECIRFNNNLQLAPNWQQHLALMVTAEDPIKYLGEHLDE